ncbi:MAG: RNA polymerase sigma factor [Muribaculaceae bacterium]
MKLISQIVLSDDRRAFARLVDAYQPILHNFFLNLTAGDEALCDDLAQETFIKAYANIRQFRGLSKFKTWLFRIAYNEFYTYARRTKEVLTEEPIEPPDMLTRDEEGNDARMDAFTAMQYLSADERTVISLFFINDMPMKKIAEITGMPEGTIKSHISRGKAKMAKLLDPH